MAGPHPHDAAYKSLFASRRTVADTLRGALRDLAASLDFSTLERLRLVSRRFGPGTAERLVRVLDPLSDPERIVAVADAVLECQTAEEFIARARKAAGTP